MSIDVAEDRVKAILFTVTGMKYVMLGYPTSNQNPPLCYIEADSGERTQAGQLTSNTYRIIATVCVSRHDNTLAEKEIAKFIDALPDAVDADPTLGGAVNLARVDAWRTGNRPIGEMDARVCDFTIWVREKKSYQS